MFNFLITGEGGLTAAGYGVSAGAGIFLFLAGSLVKGHVQKGNRISTRQMVFCSMAMALAFLTSYIKLFSAPWGGSITLCSMLFICLIGYWYGVRAGVLTGLAYGILQFLQEPFVLSLFQVCCDYILAFAALGLAGLFSKSKNGLLKGYFLGILVRGAFHSLGGYLYWMEYMPETFPQALRPVYPIVYNYSYILAEGIITATILSLPPVTKALSQVRQKAIEP
ncbi:MAG: energy-coupled thiamine transporter ThiT [Lachnospiraceae bacterium]|jgi:thiamine transporter|nr:proton-coupled thiamine transporter YuaJ [Lachnospiraceae bacterium]MCI9591392.1 proton-coupled thiamine transporter YuaJ [Lachnospiraceae bacterium]MDE6929508.1 energy-coupled thiamine transporter ThiT [Lachnospiraceae bacterium]